MILSEFEVVRPVVRGPAVLRDSSLRMISLCMLSNGRVGLDLRRLGPGQARTARTVWSRYCRHVRAAFRRRWTSACLQAGPVAVALEPSGVKRLVDLIFSWFGRRFHEPVWIPWGRSKFQGMVSYWLSGPESKAEVINGTVSLEDALTLAGLS